METSSINFIIWGVRKGFERDIVQNFDPPTEITDIINDDIRQICNATIKNFYSIDRTENYILYTVFNPNTTDYVGRKGYIAISLIIKKDLIITGNIVEKLKSLTKYYEDKQRSARTLQFSTNMFAAQIAPLSVKRRKLLTSSKLTTQKGQYKYGSETELSELFSYISIEPYSKILFHSGQLELTDFKLIPHFERTFEAKIINYSSDRFVIILNGEKQQPRYGSEMELVVKASDVIKIIDKDTKDKEPKPIPPKPIINLKDFFDIQTKPTYELPGGSGGKEINYKKIAFYSIIVLVLATIAWYLVFKTDVFKSDETNDQDTLKNDTTQVVNNITIQSTDSLKPDTFIIMPKGGSFSKIAENTVKIKQSALKRWNVQINDFDNIPAGDTIWYYRDSLDHYKLDQDQNNNVNGPNTNNNGSGQTYDKVKCDDLDSQINDKENERDNEKDQNKKGTIQKKINILNDEKTRCGCP